MIEFTNKKANSKIKKVGVTPLEAGCFTACRGGEYKKDKNCERGANFTRKLLTGFTLVETLVAVSILSISILAGFTAVQGSLRNSSLTKDQITAFFLAQEGVEYVKNIRDENALYNLANPGSPRNWLYGLTESGNPCFFGNVCRIDSYAKQAVFCGTADGDCPNLNQSISGSTIGLFAYTAGWSTSRFKRELKFQSITANEVYLNVRITWTQAGILQTLEIKQLLFNHGG